METPSLDAQMQKEALADEYARSVVTPLYQHGEAPTPYERGMLRQMSSAFRAGFDAALTVEAEHPQQEPDVQLLAWATVNCHVLARRALAHTTSVYDREKWEHVLRICEKAGARSKGILRLSVPTEITDGGSDGNEQAWADLRTDGGLPESHAVGAERGPQDWRTETLLAQQVEPSEAEALVRGLEDVKAGRVRSLESIDAELAERGPSQPPEQVEKLARLFAEEYLTGHYSPLTPEGEKKRDQLMVVMLAFHAQARRLEAAGVPSPPQELKLEVTNADVDVPNEGSRGGADGGTTAAATREGELHPLRAETRSEQQAVVFDASGATEGKGACPVSRDTAQEVAPSSPSEKEKD